ncbi:hypothetical protein PSA01_66360 [Pseudonocardia saturnea]|uniref:Uncharacterized protein n=1 Tax=Pseudonocardia saturnea TaxID=33909 RepID=A0ABQ0S9K0_9PSEU|nr:hypothetical protein Pdca_05730 [Pseudonocardia autotrophica]GEC29607.1 hypothetical protein PSA01_66360 [Pseudonocardia saturnea]
MLPTEENPPRAASAAIARSVLVLVWFLLPMLASDERGACRPGYPLAGGGALSPAARKGDPARPARLMVHGQPEGLSRSDAERP